MPALLACTYQHYGETTTVSLAVPHRLDLLPRRILPPMSHPQRLFADRNIIFSGLVRVWIFGSVRVWIFDTDFVFAVFSVHYIHVAPPPTCGNPFFQAVDTEKNFANIGEAVLYHLGPSEPPTTRALALDVAQTFVQSVLSERSKDKRSSKVSAKHGRGRVRGGGRAGGREEGMGEKEGRKGGCSISKEAEGGG